MFRYTRIGLLTVGLLAPSISLAADIPSTNIEIIEKQLAEMNRGNWKTALDVYTPDTRNFGRKVGRAVMARIFQDIYKTFPDFKQEIVEIVAVGDSVIVREKMTGTHDGMGRIPVNGGMLVGVVPTGHRYQIDAIHWYKLTDGKIIDHYAVRDDLKMMQDLGLSPKPAPFDWAAFAAEANTKR